MNHRFFCILGISLLLCGACNNKSPEERPSGLKNMAPPPIQEEVQQGLDVEPNDTFLQAASITLTGDAIQWAGTLSPQDVDVWHIKAKAGTVAEISVIPEQAADLVVDYSLTPNENTRRFYDVSHGGDPEILPNIRMTPKGGYLTIKSRQKTEAGEIPYRVQIQRIQVEQDVMHESEPNDSIESALTLNPASAKGFLYPSGEVDYYRLTIDKPGILSFKLPDSAVEVSIFSNDQKIWSMVSRNAQTVQSEILQTTKPNLVIVVKSLENIDKILPYALSFEALSEIPDEIEPNDTMDKAQSIQGDIQSLEFNLSSTLDVDIFQVELSPERMYRARLSGIEPGQAKLELINKDNQPVSNVMTDGYVICGIPVTTDNKIYLKVTSGGGGNLVFPQKYKIILESELTQEMEKEPNQDRLQAMDIPMGSVVKGNIFPAEDIDNYRIVVPEIPGITGPVGELNIDIDAGYVAPLQLNLQDSEGFEISRLNNPQHSSPIHLSFDAPAGFYNLEITGAGDGCVKPYVLKVSLKQNQNLPENTEGLAQIPEEAVPNEQPTVVNENEDNAEEDSVLGDPGDPMIDELIKAAQQDTPSSPEKSGQDDDGF